MKNFLLAVCITIMLAACASSPAYVGNSGSNNGAISFMQTQKKSTTCQQSMATPPNIFETTEKDKVPDQITVPEPSNLEKRVSSLEKRVGEHDLVLKKHSGEISGIKARLAHNYSVLADVNRRATGLENELHLGRELKQVEVSFKAGSSELSQNGKRKLDKAISKNPEMTPKFIVGATDPSGSKEKNQALALKRAHAVKDYIESQGVTITLGLKIIVQIETHRYGNCRPQNRVAILHYE